MLGRNFLQKSSAQQLPLLTLHIQLHNSFQMSLNFLAQCFSIVPTLRCVGFWGLKSTHLKADVIEELCLSFYPLDRCGCKGSVLALQHKEESFLAEYFM